MCSRKKQLVQNLIPPLNIYIHLRTLYTYKNICMPRFSPSGFFGHSRCLIPTPGLTTEYPIRAVCVCVYTHIHPHTLPPESKIKKTQITPLSLLLSNITPHEGWEANGYLKSWDLYNLFASTFRNGSGNRIVLLSAKMNPSVGIRTKKHRQPENKHVEAVIHDY